MLSALLPIFFMASLSGVKRIRESALVQEAKSERTGELPSSLTVRQIDAGEGIKAIQCVTDPFNDVFSYNIGACVPMYFLFICVS